MGRLSPGRSALGGLHSPGNGPVTDAALCPGDTRSHARCGRAVYPSSAAQFELSQTRSRTNHAEGCLPCCSRCFGSPDSISWPTAARSRRSWAHVLSDAVLLIPAEQENPAVGCCRRCLRRTARRRNWRGATAGKQQPPRATLRCGVDFVLKGRSKRKPGRTDSGCRFGLLLQFHEELPHLHRHFTA